MSESNVIRIPVRFQHRLPADAIPQGKKRHGWVFPYEGRWAFMESDEGGGSFITGLAKHEAVGMAVELAMDYCGTITLDNDDTRVWE